MHFETVVVSDEIGI